jgi:hypothetical protein
VELDWREQDLAGKGVPVQEELFHALSCSPWSGLRDQTRRRDSKIDGGGARASSGRRLRGREANLLGLAGNGVRRGCNRENWSYSCRGAAAAGPRDGGNHVHIELWCIIFYPG